MKKLTKVDGVSYDDEPLLFELVAWQGETRRMGRPHGTVVHPDEEYVE